MQRQRARRLQRLQEVEKAEQEQRARDRASASREQADFERRKQQSVNQLRMPDGSDGTIHDLKPVPTGQQNADRDTAIKPVPPRRAGPVIRNNPSKEAAAASAAGSAATLHGNDAAKALTGEVFDSAGRRAPANEVDFPATARRKNCRPESPPRRNTKIWTPRGRAFTTATPG